MEQLKWEVVPEGNIEGKNGKEYPGAWVAEINHPEYGKYCWIENTGEDFVVMVDYQKPFPQDDMTILAHCCCLSDAKDWVMVHIMGAPTDEFGEIIDE